MDTKEAIERVKKMTVACDQSISDAEYFGGMPDNLHKSVAKSADSINVVLAELARVTAERDRLIEKWPSSEKRSVYLAISGKWSVSRGWSTFAGRDPVFDTRIAAVRAAAGLDPESQEVPA